MFNVQLKRYFILVQPFKDQPHKMVRNAQQFVGNSRRIFWMRLTILWGWFFKGLKLMKRETFKMRTGNILASAHAICYLNSHWNMKSFLNSKTFQL